MFPDFSQEVFQFIRDHEKDDERELVLKHKRILGIASSIIADQIAARRKAKIKLPLWYDTPGIIFPPHLNLEQSSSVATGQFKQRILIEQLPAFENGIDLTGGFGIDSFFLSRIFKTFRYNEPNTPLKEIAEHNLSLLGARNIEYHSGPAASFLSKITAHQDLIFLDPSRRTSQKKVFTLADSEPNIISLQDEVFQKTEHLLIKASPLLDIKLGIRELKFVKRVWVVAVGNEVKELLFLCKKDFVSEPEITAMNLSAKQEESFSFRFSEEIDLSTENSGPQDYIYEPNAAILKAGAFKTVGKRFDLNKIHPNTHLYTSALLLENFSGRIFKTEARLTTDPAMLRPYFPDNKANIITRNYPLTVDELKRKSRLNDGGDKYLLAFSGGKEKYLFAASRLK